MLNRRLRTRRALPVVSVVSVALLSGCGVAGAQFHPGVAADVGDTTITTRHLDKVSHDYCAGFEKISKGDPQQGGSEPVPLRYVTNQFATILVVHAAAEQLADDYGVEPSSTSKAALAQVEPEIADLSEDQKDAFREILGADGYSQDVLAQVGEISLKDQGTTDSSADEQKAEGHKLLDAWVADHDVEINPKYAVDLAKGAQVDTDLSYPLSKNAKAGLKPAPDSAYTASLPSNLVCLD